MIRIAHLIGSLQIGGAENQVVQMVSNLPVDQYDAYVITLVDKKAGFRSALPGHVKYYCLQYRRRFAPLGWWRLYRYLRTNNIAVLQCHMYQAIWMGAIIGRLAGVRVIIATEHGTDQWQRPRHHWVERYAITPLVNFRVAVTDDIRRLRMEHDNVPADKIGVIKNAIPTDVPQADPTRPVRVIGSLGRLVYEKDFFNLIRAARVLKDQGREFQILIAGEGKDKEELLSLIQALGVENHVKLVGVRPASEFLRGIDLFVMSSRDEGMPIALLEAMSHGLPIVATRAGGIPEVIRDKTQGLLCPVENPAALAEAISEMMDNPSLRRDCAAAARQAAVDRYGVEQAGLQWRRLYGELLTIQRANA